MTVREASLVERAAVRRGALVAIAAAAGILYAWALDRDPLEPYYAGAVRSMSMSWHNWFFGAFDPAGTITLDKLPGAFWVQALAVRVFGFHAWCLVLPQVVEGVVTVLVLYKAVQRLAGHGAGLTAAAVLTLSPATVALDRGNISDSLMVMLLVLAASAVSTALVTGRRRPMVLAGVWVGLAFQAKMVEAWMVLPALALAYVVAGPPDLRKRVAQLAALGAVAVAISLSWMTAVTLVPSESRPYVDGSHNDSVYTQVFVYNGFGRFGQATPLQLLSQQSLGLGLASTPPAAPDRLFRGQLGRDTGWLLPAGLAATALGLWARRRRLRDDPVRACLLLWGGWLVVFGLVFTVTTSLNSYYLAALSPAIAAVIGVGLTELVSWWSSERARARAAAGTTAAAVVAGTVAYAAWLLPASRPGNHTPGWLAPALLVVGGAGAVVLAVSAWGRRRPIVLAAGLVAAVIGALAAPATASVELAVHHEGAFDTPYQPASYARSVDALFLRTPAAVDRTIPTLLRNNRGAPYLLATQTAAVASVFVEDSGLEALPIGGFTGTVPSPTLHQLEADIRQGLFHLVLAGTTPDPRIVWIATHCLDVGRPTPALNAYYCLPRNAGR